MELRCAIVCSLVSFVIATPHGYGSKGGAAARAEAGAVASAFSGISGLPLSIPNGAVSGSFSKSASSSFASSSASSSSGSFSFSGSGATGLSGFLGLPGNDGCKSGGCQSGSRINSPQESSAGNGLSSYSGAHAAAAAGAIAGVQNGANNLCTGNNCYTHKLPCEGNDCEDVSSTINNNTPKKCSSAQCNKTESGSSGGDTSDICAKGQCMPKSGSTSTDFNDNKDCTSGSCTTDTDSKTPSKNYDANDIPGDTPGSPSLTSGSSSSSNNQPSDYDKTNNEAPKESGIDCLHGNCGSSAQNLKSSNNYPREHLHSGSPSSSTAPAVQSAISQQDNKFPNKITGASSPVLGSLEPGPYQSPKTQQTTCVEGYCNNEPIFKSPTNTPSQSTVAHLGCVSGKCDSVEFSHHPNFDLSGSKTPSHSSVSDSSQKCVSGHCASHSSESSYFSSSGSGSQTPSYSPESSPTGSTNCASGNCGAYPTGQNSGSHDDSKSVTPTHSDSPLNKPYNCVSGNCADYPSSLPTNYDSPAPNAPNHKPSNCALGKCNSSPSIQFPNFDTSNLKNPTNPTGVSGSSNCASGNCPSAPRPGITITQPKSPTYFPGTSPSGSSNCAFGNCGFPVSQHPHFDGLGPKNPVHATATTSSLSNCATGNCASLATGSGFTTMGLKLPSYSSGILSSGSPNCGNGNCGNPPSVSAYSTNQPKSSSNCALGNCYPPSQYPGFTSSSNTLVKPETSDTSVSCAFGNCANVPSTNPNGNIGTGTKSPSDSPSTSQYPNSNVSGPKTPAYFGGAPGISDCALGNCGNVPLPGHFKPQIPNNIQGAQPSVSPNCASGNCENLPSSGTTDFSSAGHKIPTFSHKIPSGVSANCASGNCGSYPHGQYSDFSKPPLPSNVLHGFAGSKFPTHSQGPSPSGSTNCLSNDCNIPSLQPTGLHTTSKIPSQPNDSFPAFIPLAPTNPTHVVGSSGSTSTHTGEPINSVNPIYNSGVAGGAHSSSSVFAISKPSSKNEQIYTGGFGGPPGILNPYEFKPPPPSGYYSTANKATSSSSCSSGICASHPVSNPDNNREILGTNNPVSCGSEKCDSHTNSPNYAQHGASNAALSVAAASSDGNRAVYMGGFGGPPGILKPYDGGKITGGTTNIFMKGSIDHQNRPDRYGMTGSPSNKLNSFGAQAGAAALARAGAYSSGNHAGDNKGAGGCQGICGSPGSSSLGGSIEWSGVLELPKTGISNDELDAARAVAKGTEGAIAGAGANSFGFGGSFASSSAHAASGSSTKRGYGR